MADWQDVTLKAGILINDAQTYLDRRAQQATDSRERRGISNWRNRLNRVRVDIMKYQPAEESAPSAEARYQVLLDHLELTGQHIQQLHEWFDYANVDLVLRNLNYHLTLLVAGPHGPGKGPRIP